MKDKNGAKNLLVIIVTLCMLVGATVALVSLSSGGEKECKHKFGGWSVIKEAGDFECGEKRGKCKKCGEETSERIEALISMPQIYFDGDTSNISKETFSLMNVKYIDSEQTIEAYATVKNQGHTAMSYDKKNFTIKFFEDNMVNEKLKVSLNGWGKTHKYCLKANYIDFSNSRNIVSSHIWSDVVSSRKNLDENIAPLEFKGGIDGYPIAVFINGEYHGLYTMNIPKDEDTYEIADSENEAMFVINSGFADSAKFRSLITDEDKKSVFDLEYVYPEEAQWPFESLNKLIGFVMENDGENFRNGIGEYLDVDSAIDYLATAYALGLTDNFSKNMILLTYDGKKWITNLYDLDTACGLEFDGRKYYEPDFSIPEKENGKINSNTDNLLWDRILNNFTSEFVSRYKELRSDILSEEKLIKRYSDFHSMIPSECFEEEIKLYPDIPFSDVDQIGQISQFITSRCEKLDNAIYNF